MSGFFHPDAVKAERQRLISEVADRRAQVINVIAEECERELGAAFGRFACILLSKADGRILKPRLENVGGDDV